MRRRRKDVHRMEKVLAEATLVLLLTLVIMAVLQKQNLGLLLLVCHVQSRIMLRQQDCMGKHFSTVFIINFENTGLLASVFFIFFQQETHPSA